ncbi:MAG: segregation/condensation protein A [Firmicutes bacterium]|nr:segregation/condensation protein A [Bacillota bacterium]
MDYEIKLDVFQGPLDLLLHLIEKEEVDIYNIPIAIITEKYLDYLQTLQMLNLEVVGDFLVMAATLMQIKVKMLLPQTVLDSEETTEDNENDPRWELAQKLLEYKKIKEASLSLQQLESCQSLVYTRSGGEFADQKITAVDDPLKDLSVWDLVDAFKIIMDSLEEKPINSLPKQEISIKQRMIEIMDLVIIEGKILFQKVFSEVKTKLGLITCFLAVLELIRLCKITASQSALFGEIILTIPEKVSNTA